MPLDTLPAELIDNICSYCSVDEIKNIRQTCRSLRQVADEHLLTEMQLFMTKKRLATCIQIAKHPVFGKSVKSIWIPGDRPKTKPYDLWVVEAENEWERLATCGSHNKDLINELEHHQLTVTDCTQTQNEKMEKRREIVQRMKEEGQRRTAPPSETQLWRHYEIYNSLTREAEQMLRDGTYYDCLRAVFKRCVNLQDVYYTIGDTIYQVTGKNFEQGLQDTLGDPDSELYRDGLAGMTQVINAASGVGFKPRRLCLGGVCHTLFSPALSEVSHQLPPFMKDLKYLHWEFPAPWLDLEDNGGIDELELESIAADFQSGVFVELMKHTTQLQSLKLEPSPPSDEFSARPSLSALVGDIIWPNLQTFSVSSIRTSSDDLVQFLLRHSDTLKEISLENISLTTASWPDCFGAFAGKLKALKSVNLTGGLDELGFPFCRFSHRSDGYAQQLADYILHGNVEFPVQELPGGSPAWAPVDLGEIDSDTDLSLLINPATRLPPGARILDIV